MNLNGVKTLFIIINTFLLSSCINQGNEKLDYLNYAIIPKPLSIDSTNNQRIFNSLNVLENEKCKNEISIFKKTIQRLYTKKENLFNVNGFPLDLKIDNNQNIGSEYILEITKEKILITAKNNTGLFYGLQSLIQLIALNNHDSIGNFKIPCLTIRDNFAFEHRGLMLDCCRHFFKISTIKKYLDLLALYKMNIFHWHLTEDQGWRIEIEKYPKLNSVGSWRKDSSGIYGGYYTKIEIKEIVEYASERHIQIIPEIELPGHSSAAIASYPNLSCNKKPIEVVNDWGVFKEIYCAGNDSVFIFIEDIINEITSLFPGELIHIGGDEAPKYRWENCIKCQNRIKKEGLKNEHELQSYFIDRVANILAKKGKVIVGWDEIIDSDLVSPAIIQSWRGFNGGYNAAKSGKKAIMSPTSHAYFDYPISTTDLEKVYEFNPIPKGLDSVKKKLIIGGECNLWSERIFNEKDLDSKAFPRLLAMSEILWRNPKNKNYSIFKSRIKHHYELLERLNVQYGTEAVAVNIDLKKVEKNYYAEISTKVNGLNFKYKFSKKKFHATFGQ
jgi:hexosaminidase